MSNSQLEVTARNTELLTALRAACLYDFDRWAYDEWERLNRAYFEDGLRVGQIVWGITAYGRCIGHHEGWRNVITLHISLIEPNDTWNGGLSGRERIASDVLLHEMIHQAIYQRFGHNGCGDNRGGCSSHNNDEWAAEVNRIAPLISLPANAAVTRQQRVKADGQEGKGKVTWVTPPGALSRAELANWPHSARPSDYYQNVPFELANKLG